MADPEAGQRGVVLEQHGVADHLRGDGRDLALDVQPVVDAVGHLATGTDRAAVFARGERRQARRSRERAALRQRLRHDGDQASGPVAEPLIETEVLGAAGEGEEAQVRTSPGVEAFHRGLEQALGHAPIPQIRADGERTEQPDAAPVDEAVRADKLPRQLRGQHRAWIGPPARADDVGLPPEGHRIGQPDEGAEGDPEDAIRYTQLTLPERANDRGRHEVALTRRETAARGRARAASRAPRPMAARWSRCRGASSSGKPVFWRIVSGVTPGVRGLDPHAPGVRVEAEDAERGNDARDAAEQEPGGPARAVAGEPRRARDEVDALDEAPLLVRRHDDHLAAQRGDVVGAAGPGQADFRLPVVGAEHARVDVAVLVDLRAAHEADVDEAALGEQERVGDARQHRRPMAGAHLVGGDRQPPRRDLGADDAALDDHRQPRRVTALGERGGQQRHADAREDRRVVAELARGDHGQKLGGVEGGPGHCIERPSPAPTEGSLREARGSVIA